MALNDHDQIFAAYCVKSYWCQFYEMPFREQLGHILQTFGLVESVNEIAVAHSPIQALVKELDASDRKFASQALTPKEVEAYRPGATFFLSFSVLLYQSLRCLFGVRLLPQ
jgi:hypothetical protein